MSRLTEEQLEALKTRNEALEGELRRLKRKPEGRIGYALLGLGLALLVLAVIYSHNVASFIGIALTFWGALLLYVRPTEFVRKEVMDSLSDSGEKTASMARDLGYAGDPRYISPGTLWGLSNTVLWVPEEEDSPRPGDDDLSSQRAVLDDPPGLVLTPPGQALSRLIEEELGTSFARVDMDYLRFNLEKALVEGLEIAMGFTMTEENPGVVVEVKGSIFRESVPENPGSGSVVGDPLSSAVASIFARTTRGTVTIWSIRNQPDDITRIEYRIHGAEPEEVTEAV